MRFCFLTGLYGRKDSLMVVRQGKSLVDHGYDVTMVLCDNVRDETVDGIHFVSTQFKPKGRLERFRKTYKEILPIALRIDADVYQISDPELVSMVAPLKKKGKKVVFNMREFYPDMIKHKEYIPKLLRNGVSYFYQKMLRHYLPQYDAVIVVNQHISEILKSLWGIQNVFVISNYPWLHKDFHLTYEDYCNRDNMLCYEGTIYIESRQENVFKALEKLPEVKYLLAGKIEEGYDWIKSLDYWSEVSFVDGFTLNELPGIFNRSTIANCFRDFFGNDGSMGVIKIFDSMEAALPVLFSDVPVYRALIDRYQCGLCVDPNDSNSIEQAIKYLVGNKEVAYQMGQNGRKAVIENYCWDKEGEKYINIISNI